MTNIDTADNFQIGRTEIEKVTDFTYGNGKQNKTKMFR